MGFDFNFMVEPLNFMQRYLHFLGYDDDKNVCDTAKHLYIFKLFDSKML